MEVFHTEIRNQNSMRLVITWALPYHSSHFAICDQNSRPRAGSNPAGFIESQICIQKGYYVLFFLAVLENWEPSNTQGGPVERTRAYAA